MRIAVLLVLFFASPYSSACSRGPSADEAQIQAQLAQGRALLDAGKASEAEVLFERVAAQDGGSLRTRMWVLRARMDQGRSDETLAEIDALDRAGTKGLEMTYLYGTAFARRAEGAVASGAVDGSVEMLFQDATQLLQQVVVTEGDHYPDAYLLLARSAWYARELGTARAAADQAVSLAPAAAETWLARGRIVLSQYVAAEGESAGSARADELWGLATSSFRRAIELLGAPTTESGARGLAGASTDLAHALLWRQKAAEATEAFANAIAWAPEVPDYAEMQRLLGGAAALGDGEAPVGFRAALEAGRERLESRLAAAGTASADPRAATLLWWLGWARFADADWSGSEEAFAECLARAPAITNSWFYVGLARQYRKDHAGALAAMRAGWDAHADTMAATARGAGGSSRAFDDLIGWCVSQTPARNRDAAFLSELLTRAYPGESRHWNNLGLFLRDEGERLEIEAHRRREPAPDPALLAELYERSYAAYERALALASGDPQVLNDTALMLQYHLGRDLDQAEAMYRRSIELCEQRLAEPGLSAEARALLEQTRSDASGNLAILLAPRDEEGLAATASATPGQDP